MADASIVLSDSKVAFFQEEEYTVFHSFFYSVLCSIA